jgi:hypothetical protein
MNGQIASQHSRALSDADQSKASSAIRNVEAFAIVADNNPHDPVVSFNDHLSLGRFGVFDDVIQALLNDAVEIDLGLFREDAVNPIDLESQVEAG